MEAESNFKGTLMMTQRMFTRVFIVFQQHHTQAKALTRESLGDFFIQTTAIGLVLPCLEGLEEGY